jgi:hypothetical protein
MNAMNLKDGGYGLRRAPFSYSIDTINIALIPRKSSTNCVNFQWLYRANKYDEGLQKPDLFKEDGRVQLMQTGHARTGHNEVLWLRCHFAAS